MTAEIAILNKTAVALAADSAVTISAGSNQQKIFDSADKLFELSVDQPIGVMINNDMNFMEAPLPVLIKDYRSRRCSFRRVEEAGLDFLKFLHEFGLEAPEQIKLENLRRAITPILQTVPRRSISTKNSR